MSDCSILMQTYFFYSALLALKLLALVPLASIWCNPEKMQRAHLSDLKNLTPFWLLAALYTTTCPDPATFINLMRAFAAARAVSGFSYVTKLPPSMVELAFFVSFSITSYMGAMVVFNYKNAL